jgi:magnesium-transporting ATPase (P-type)
MLKIFVANFYVIHTSNPVNGLGYFHLKSGVSGAIPPRRKRPSLWNRNQKYSIITFIPLVLFNQFKFFLNLFFLIMACSQFIPVLRSAVDILANQCCGTETVGTVIKWNHKISHRHSIKFCI